nr:sulfite exporter TauE/SafE family protein [Lysinibacillus timonensis]
MTYVLLSLIALTSGIIGSLVGLGGGVILIPATLFIGITLGYIPSLTPQTVVGLSVIMMIFTGLSSTLAHMKSKTVDYKSGFIFFVGSIPGTMLGAWVNQYLNLPSFNLYFGILLVILSILLLVRDKLKPVEWFVQHGMKRNYIDSNGVEYIYGYPIWFAIAFTFIVGFCSGLFGIGGGSMIVPAMLLLFRFPPHVAVATSMFLVFLSSLVNSASHISLGNVPWIYTIPIIIGAFVGAQIGSTLNKKMKSETLIFALRMILLLLGIRSIYDGLF